MHLYGWPMISSLRYGLYNRSSLLPVLQKLSNHFFDHLLAEDYHHALYLYEYRLHVIKKRYFKMVLALKKHDHSRDELPEMALFNHMMNIMQFRRRVSDYTIFGLCRDEIMKIKQAMAQIFRDLVLRFKDTHHCVHQKTLLISIDQLENLFFNVLNVTSREPLVFILWIDALRAFSRAVDQYCDEI